MANIKTSGEVRQFLVETMQEIKEGKVEGEVARNVIKISAQINESFYSEAKIAKLKMDAGQSADKIGQLPLN